MTKQFIATILAFAAIGAQAQSTIDASVDAPKTRAEVVADLEAYQMAGLQYLDRQENPNYGSPAYVAAKKRYNDLRNSPKFAQMIRQHAAETGELSQLAQAQSAAAKQK